MLEERRPALQRIIAVTHDGVDLWQVLFDTGVAYLQLELHPDVIAIDRLVVGEAKRLPELTRIYHASGPNQTLAAMLTLVDCKRSAGPPMNS